MNNLKAIFPVEALDKVVDKMKELGVKGAYQAFDYQDRKYMALFTSNLSLYFFCKGLLSPEEQKFFY